MNTLHIGDETRLTKPFSPTICPLHYTPALSDDDGYRTSNAQRQKKEGATITKVNLDIFFSPTWFVPLSFLLDDGSLCWLIVVATMEGDKLKQAESRGDSAVGGGGGKRKMIFWSNFRVGLFVTIRAGILIALCAT